MFFYHWHVAEMKHEDLKVWLCGNKSQFSQIIEVMSDTTLLNEVTG